MSSNILDLDFFSSVRACRDCVGDCGDLARLLILGNAWPGDAGWDSTSFLAWLRDHGATPGVMAYAGSKIRDWQSGSRRRGCKRA